jgi:hypothetical protein
MVGYSFQEQGSDSDLFSPAPVRPAPALVESAAMLTRALPMSYAELDIAPFSTELVVDTSASPARTRRSVELNTIVTDAGAAMRNFPGSPTGAAAAIDFATVDGGWINMAVARYHGLLLASVREPATVAEVALQTQQRWRFEHFSASELLESIPVSYCNVSADIAMLEAAVSDARELAAQEPYVCHFEPTLVYPPEVKPKENLMPEDPYDLLLRPAQYLANFRKSHYVAMELNYLEHSNVHVHVAPTSTVDYHTAALSLTYDGPCRKWNLDELMNALQNFRYPDTFAPPRMTKLFRELRDYLLRYDRTHRLAGRMLFDALEQMEAENANRSPRRTDAAVLTPPPTPQPLLGKPHTLLSSAGPTEPSRSSVVRRFLTGRTYEERKFLLDFYLSARHCAHPTSDTVYKHYVEKSAQAIASAVMPAFRPLTHTLAMYCKHVITTSTEFNRVVREWHRIMTDADTGVPRASLARYANELEVQCPRAFAFRNVFNGATLVNWVLANEDKLGIQLADSALVVRRGERESNAAIFASNLITAGLIHAVSFNATMSGRNGIVTEPERFRDSVMPQTLYRFLCHEPRQAFTGVPLPAELGMDRSDPQAVMVIVYTLCKAALQWLYDDQASTPQQVRAVCNQLLPFIAECNITALTPLHRACLFINLFNTLFCLIFAYYRHSGACVDIDIAFHTHYMIVAGMQYTLADMKHGILRANKPDPRMILKPFAPDDTRTQFCMEDPDPRWLLMLLDLADDHEVEKVSEQPAVHVRTPAPADDTSEDDVTEQPQQPEGAARGALETAHVATRQYGTTTAAEAVRLSDPLMLQATFANPSSSVVVRLSRVCGPRTANRPPPASSRSRRRHSINKVRGGKSSGDGIRKWRCSSARRCTGKTSTRRWRRRRNRSSTCSARRINTTRTKLRRSLRPTRT